MNKLKRLAIATTTGALILGSLATPAFAAKGAEVIVDPGQSVTGTFTKDFNRAPVAEVEFSGGNSTTVEVTGTICDGTLVWSLSAAVSNLR